MPFSDVAVAGACVARSSVAVAVRSGVGTYAGAARRRVHLVTVLLRPPSGHRPGRRQTRHESAKIAKNRKML